MEVRSLKTNDLDIEVAEQSRVEEGRSQEVLDADGDLTGLPRNALRLVRIMRRDRREAPIGPSIGQREPPIKREKLEVAAKDQSREQRARSVPHGERRPACDDEANLEQEDRQSEIAHVDRCA